VKGVKAMAKSLLRTGKEIESIYGRHKDMLFRICFAYMKNSPDTEDVIQDTFINLLKSGPIFESMEHEKAWLIRTASNLCKNALGHWWRKRENLEAHKGIAGSEIEIDETFGMIMNLPAKYKTVVYLYYYEGYTSAEIAQILQKPQSTIRYFLVQARKLLRDVLRGDNNEE